MVRMKDPIFANLRSKKHVISLDWASFSEHEEQGCYRNTILFLLQHMKQRRNEEQDLLFMPLLVLVKEYLLKLKFLDMPEEIRERINYLWNIIVYIEEQDKKNKKINIVLSKFINLLEEVISQEDTILATREDTQLSVKSETRESS